MRRAWVIASVLAFASAAAFAEAPSDAAVDLAAIFASPTGSGPCAVARAGALPAVRGGGPEVQNVCTADGGVRHLQRRDDLLLAGERNDNFCDACHETGDCLFCCRCNGGSWQHCWIACA